jgi:hypothetical protein
MEIWENSRSRVCVCEKEIIAIVIVMQQEMEESRGQLNTLQIVSDLDNSVTVGINGDEDGYYQARCDAFLLLC